MRRLLATNSDASSYSWERVAKAHRLRTSNSRPRVSLQTLLHVQVLQSSTTANPTCSWLIVCYVAAEPLWNRRTHCLFPTTFQEAVKTLLLCYQREDQCILHMLPPEVLWLVIEQLSYISATTSMYLCVCVCVVLCANQSHVSTSTPRNRQDRCLGLDNRSEESLFVRVDLLSCR
jgi:hypothetical protein